MLELTIHQGEWVVGCDGAKALLLENTGDTKFPNLRMVEVFEHRSLATRELGAAASGRSHSSTGHGSSSVEQTDWHDQEERAFLLELVRHLDDVLAAGKTKSLIVVAPPRALGVLRPAYSHAVKAAVRSEIDKDYVKLPIYEIEKHLSMAPKS